MPWRLLGTRVLSPVGGFEKVTRRARDQWEYTAGGGEGKGRDQRGLICSVTGGRRRGGCWARLARIPSLPGGGGGGGNAVHFAWRMDAGVGGGAALHKDPPGVERDGPLTRPLPDGENRPSGLLPPARMKKGE